MTLRWEIIAHDAPSVLSGNIFSIEIRNCLFYKEGRIGRASRNKVAIVLRHEGQIAIISETQPAEPFVVFLVFRNRWPFTQWNVCITASHYEKYNLHRLEIQSVQKVFKRLKIIKKSAFYLLGFQYELQKSIQEGFYLYDELFNVPINSSYNMIKYETYKFTAFLNFQVLQLQSLV